MDTNQEVKQGSGVAQGSEPDSKLAGPTADEFAGFDGQFDGTDDNGMVRTPPVVSGAAARRLIRAMRFPPEPTAELIRLMREGRAVQGDE